MRKNVLEQHKTQVLRVGVHIEHVSVMRKKLVFDHGLVFHRRKELSNSMQEQWREIDDVDVELSLTTDVVVHSIKKNT